MAFRRFTVLGIGSALCVACGYRSISYDDNYPSKWFGVILLILIAIALRTTGYHKVPAMSTSNNPKKEFIPLPITAHNKLDYSMYNQVLSEYVVNGRVKFVDLRKSIMRDKRKDSPFIKWLQILSKVGPNTTPNLFPDDNERLKYYMNAYNALTIYGVIHHSFYYENNKKLITSVMDVPSSRFVPKFLQKRARGFGFFKSALYELDGKDDVSLDHLEHQLIRAQFKDARIHCAINCASVGCPTLQSYVIDVQHLDDLCKEFVNNSNNVMVDMEKRQIKLSKIFEWYSADFEMFYDQREDQSEARFDEQKQLYFIWKYANEELKGHIVDGMKGGFGIEFVPYDWSLIKAKI